MIKTQTSQTAASVLRQQADKMMHNLRFMSYTLLTVLTVDLLATSGDITVTWTSPMLTKLYSNDTDINPFDKPITEEEDSWIGSMVNIGAMIGPIPYSILAERFGRKVALLAIAIPHICSYLTLAFSRSVYLYYFARFLGGCAVGGGYTVLPMYVAEVSEDNTRGMMSVTLNIFWTFGNFLPYLIGPYLNAMNFNIILACIPASFFVLFLLIAPETPYYLVHKKEMQRAEDSLKKLRRYENGSSKSLTNDIEHIKTVLAHNEDSHFSDIFKNRIYIKALLISAALVIAQQLSGINAVLFYTEEIFKEAGATDISPEISSIIVGAVLFSTSFVTPFLADTAGRKILLIISLVGIIIWHIAFSIFFFLTSSDTGVNPGDISWLPITSMIGFIVTFNIGLGPLPWTISSELFPAGVKSAAAPLVSISCWVASFIVTKFFLQMKESLQSSGTFCFYAAFCLLALIFTIIFVPETKGKSFKEIQEVLDHKKKKNDEDLKC